MVNKIAAKKKTLSTDIYDANEIAFKNAITVE